MKRKIVLLLIIGVAVVVNAQQYTQADKPLFVPEHDFRFGVGAKPFEAANITFGYDYFYENRIDFDTKDYYSGARYTTNSWFFEYIYQVNKWFGIGATANYLGYYNQYYDGATDVSVGHNLTQHFSLYPTIRLTWLKSHTFSVYSAIGLGTRFAFNNDIIYGKTDNHNFRTGIAGQITLLGFTVGRNVYGFTDLLTLGSQGMLNVGLGYRLTVPQKRK